MRDEDLIQRRQEDRRNLMNVNEHEETDQH